MTQPGYDALAQLYADTFPNAYLTPLERHTMHTFADLVTATAPDGRIVDVGCGIGHITADLARFGRPVIGVDPSPHMLSLARDAHPECEFACDDAHLDTLAPDRPIAAIVARFSLIHVPPDTAVGVLARWSARIEPGGLLLVATQCADDEPVVEFDHVPWRPPGAGTPTTSRRRCGTPDSTSCGVSSPAPTASCIGSPRCIWPHGGHRSRDLPQS
ncbi:hypothetical protein GCM10009624_20360 [Gordonia sinesedis]